MQSRLARSSPLVFAGSSSGRQNLVTNEVKADDRRAFASVEVIGPHGFFHVVAQLFQVVSLREDTLRQTLGDQTAVGFLSDFEHEFAHALILIDSVRRNNSLRRPFQRRRASPKARHRSGEFISPRWQHKAASTSGGTSPSREIPPNPKWRRVYLAIPAA